MNHWIEHFKEKWYDTDKRRMGFIMYFGCLFLYGFLFHDGEIYDKLLRYSKTIIVCVILYLLLYAMERVSLKKLFSSKMPANVNKTYWFFLGVGTCICGIYFVIEGFTELAFVVPIILWASFEANVNDENKDRLK